MKVQIPGEKEPRSFSKLEVLNHLGKAILTFEEAKVIISPEYSFVVGKEDVYLIPPAFVIRLIGSSECAK